MHKEERSDAGAGHHGKPAKREHLRGGTANRGGDAGEYAFENLMLRDADLAHCRGCYVCFAKGEEHCPIRDDAPAIERRMHEADATIFATPVYGMNVSGLMKIFIDRFSYIFHRPRFFTRKAFLLTTTGAVGQKEVLDYLDLVARVWGFEIAGRAALITPPLALPRERIRENERIVRDAARTVHDALERNGRRSPSLQDVLIFHGQRAAFIELGEESPVDMRTGRRWVGLRREHATIWMCR